MAVVPAAGSHEEQRSVLKNLNMNLHFKGYVQIIFKKIIQVTVFSVLSELRFVFLN